MTVLICATFGAMKRYRDQEMMKLTFSAFLKSVVRQTDGDFRLFISCHDKPEWAPDDLRFSWISLACDPDNEFALAPKFRKVESEVFQYRPEDLRLPDEIVYEAEPYGPSISDMGRKTFRSAIEAGMWAYKNGVGKFWMLRMDSDDLLANDHVSFLNAQDPAKVRAVFNRKCHIYDPVRKELGIYDYKFSTTCNALYMEMVEDILPNWFYQCIDHTLFARMVKRDGIPSLEKDWTMCILSNSGNSISNRGRIEENREAVVTHIPTTREIQERYGLDSI